MKDPVDSWRDTVEFTIQHLELIFVTQSEFNKHIKQLINHIDSPLISLQFHVSSPDPMIEYTFGDPGSGDPDSRTHRINDNRDTTCRVLYWEKREIIGQSSDLNDLLLRLFHAFWKPSIRTESAGLPDLKREARVTDMANETILHHAQNSAPSSILFCDLDNFKQVNTQFGHDAGDRIIKVFGALIEQATGDNSIPLHRGGDEFVLLLPGGGATDALLAAYRLYRSFSEHDFNVDLQGFKLLHNANNIVERPVLQIGTSIGLASSQQYSSDRTFEELSEAANLALNEYAKKPVKGVARFLPNEYVVSQLDALLTPEVSLDAALCLVKSSLSSSEPFSSIWLNCLSRIAYAEAESPLWADSIQKEITNFLDWAKLPYVPYAGFAFVPASDDVSGSIQLSGLDACFAIIHGLMRVLLQSEEHPEGWNKFSLASDSQYQEGGILLENDTYLWSSSDLNALGIRFSCGIPWRSVDNQLPPSSARALLVQIGHDDFPMPSLMFVDRITVDDRPTSGGGLPDFWEATIARTVARVVTNPNITVVYVVGKREFGVQTVQRLGSIEKWIEQADELAYKTGMSVQEIRQAAESLLGNVQFPHDEADLIRHLAGRLRLPHTFLTHTTPTRPQKRFLKRPAAIDTMRLEVRDGCRVKTIAEAYPVVIDVLRHGETEDVIRDQAGQQLRELIDFKVHLTNPSQDQVPSFYIGEKALLDGYFHKEFLSEDGLFSSAFNAKGQIKAVVEHVADIIVREQLHSTRRAILIVPNVLDDKHQLQPLGLISVRIFLRFIQNRIILNYSFAWRTVEVLVGFPYSLYGSVRFAEHLTDSVKARVPHAKQRQIESGEVSYIAHSLHFFVDDYGHNIARRIVDEAST